MTQTTLELQPRLAARTQLEPRAKLLAHLGNGWHLAEFGIAPGAGLAAGSVALTGLGRRLARRSARSLGDRLALQCRPRQIHTRGAAGAAAHREQLLPARRLHRLARAVRLGRRLPPSRKLGRRRTGRVHHADDAAARARAKRKVGRALNSSATVREAGQNQICAYLSLALLAGLLLNAVAGWWWADPAAAIVIAALALHEGREAWRRDACDCC